MAESAKQEWEMPDGGMDLEATLFCGQSFCWQREVAGYRGVAGQRQVLASQHAGVLRLCGVGGEQLTPADLAFWRHYFALDVDYRALCARLAQHATLAACVEHAPGIRVLRQPFFDTLVSFIFSQTNNIPRIAGMVQRLCALLGPPLPGGGRGFPSAEALAALEVEDLAPVRAGFRAKYVLAAARMVAQGQVEEAILRTLPDDAAREVLMQIPGVGPKVADCVLLFALGRTGVVPMDVWMKRAMAQYFPDGMPACAAGWEGVAQQYVFAWVRKH